MIIASPVVSIGENQSNMHNRVKKISGHLENPLVRMLYYLAIVTFMAGVTWATLRGTMEDNRDNLTEHKDNTTSHMTLEEKQEVVIMDARIEQNAKDVQTVKDDLKEDINLLRQDMNQGFRDLKEFIKNNNRGG